jgi:hypothetical protein
MPEKKTLEEAKELKREHKAPSTQAGPFVEEEIRHVREGKHGARSTKQAIAIGLSKAREAGVDLPPPPKGRAKASTRASAKRAQKRGQSSAKKRAPSAKRSRAATRALKREGHSAASKKALSRHAHAAAKSSKKK